jgi:hypothetical protein
METLSMFRLHAALVLPALSLLVLGLNGQDAETKKEEKYRQFLELKFWSDFFSSH